MMIQYHSNDTQAVVEYTQYLFKNFILMMMMMMMLETEVNIISIQIY